MLINMLSWALNNYYDDQFATNQRSHRPIRQAVVRNQSFRIFLRTFIRHMNIYLIIL
jgi:hypothetical protein